MSTLETTPILITGALHATAIEAFEKDPLLSVTYLPDCPRDRLLQEVKSCHVLITRSETTVDKELIEAAPNLKVIARAAVGVGNIDIAHATEKGILVINTPGKNTNSAAEMTLALLLGMFRNIPQAHNKVKGEGWDRHTFTGKELRGKTIGLIGLGNVGHRVAKFCQGFDMEVLAYDPYIAAQKFDQYRVKQCKTLDEIIPQVDILSVHTPLNNETRGMIGKDELKLLKHGSWVVNAARGGIVEEAALLEALESGQLTGAALDTWVGEPNINRPLASHEKVWVAPHIGASTTEAQIAIGSTIYEQVSKAVQGGVVDFPVNLPQIGVMDNPLTKPYAILAEKLGAFACQLIGFNPYQMTIQYRGDLAATDPSLIRLAFMKGYAGKAVNGHVSFVNAPQEFDRLGINLEESEDPNFESYRSALKINIFGEEGNRLSVGGIVFDHRYPRVSLIDDFYFEVEPSGEFLVVENKDTPGVIGDVGTFLADHKINIDSFDLARNSKGGRALAIVKVDSTPDSQTIKAMHSIPNLEKVHYVSL